MPEPLAAEVVDEFQDLLLQRDKRAAREVARAMGEVVSSLEDDVARVVEEAQGKGLSIRQIRKLSRYEQLLEFAKDRFDDFTKQASGIISASQSRAAKIAADNTRRAVDAALPLGIDSDTLARLGLQWNRLPDEALTNFVGISGDGKPLRNLLTPLGQESTQGVIDGITEGIAKGWSPRKTARQVRDNSGLPLTRALRISRTETLRAHREATRTLYRGNSDVVKGWRRLATFDGRTCMACLALDGTLYETRQPMDSHPNCRCAMVPETIGYADLGLDVPEDDRPRERGADWFRRQDAKLQEEMLGKQKFLAMRSGLIEVEDMVTFTNHPVWGRSATESSLKSLLLTPVPSRRFAPAMERLQRMGTPVGGEVRRRLESMATLSPSGKELSDALTQYTRDFRNSGAYKVGAVKWAKGIPRITAAERHGAVIGEAMAQASQRQNSELFRGIVAKNTSLNEFAARYQVGQKFSHPPSSFSVSRDTAQKFSTGVSVSTVGRNDVSVIFTLESGAEVMNVEPLSIFAQGERLVQGGFEVTGIRTVTRGVGTPLLRQGLEIQVKQVDTIDLGDLA